MPAFWLLGIMLLRILTVGLFSSAGRALVLPVADPGLISSTPYRPPSLPGVIP